MKIPTSRNGIVRLVPVPLLIAAVSLLSWNASGQSRPNQQRASAPAEATSDSLSLDQLERDFRAPPDNTKIMVRWWWFGPALDKGELEREMRDMKEGGIGGFEVQPVYPVALEDSVAGIKNAPFLSGEFIDALRFVSEKAHELGLRMDLTLGSGWPYGGAQVPISDAAGRLRYVRTPVPLHSQRVPLPDISIGEELIGAFLIGSEAQSASPPRTAQELSNIKDGAVWLSSRASTGSEILFFISSRTGMTVKRPAVGAEGFVLNHLDRTAVENYQKNVGERLLQAFGSRPPFAIFCDSLEVYQSDWTPDFLPEFRKRRGYDLKPHLPDLVENKTTTESLRNDWGKTLTELFNERFAVPMREFARRHGTLFRMQGYGTPPAALSTNALSDLPEGEGSQWKILRASRWASSASHLYARPVTSSETWTWLHSPAFRATPLDMKAEAHLHFLQGINQLIAHGWPYTAPGIAYPGWRFYAAAVFNAKNPWWIVMPDISRYLQRLSLLLRQGQPSNDVALYLPNNDAWAHFSPGKVNLIETLGERIGPDVVARVLESGFNLDFVDDEAIAQLGRVEKSELMLGTNRYKAVILPNVERIPMQTLRKLDEFARAGGVLIATRRSPAISPGFAATSADHQQVQELSAHLFNDLNVRPRFVKDENNLKAALTGLLNPDLALSPAAPEIGFVHRTLGDAELYFLVNSSNTRRTARATFRVTNLHPEWWDPITAQVSSAHVLAQSKNGITLNLDIEPYGSRVVVFSHRANAQHLASHKTVRKRASLPPPIDLAGGWQISFGKDSSKGEMQKLQSWTENDDTRYFSGSATYEKKIPVPASMLQKNLTVRLDFGDGNPIPEQPLKAGMQAWLDAPVREAAIVYVNENRAGSIWAPPYSIEVSKLLRPGENKIRVVVANLAINYMAGHALPDYRLLNLRYGVRFEPQDMDKVEPIPSGLLGPIHLVASAAVESN